MCMIFWFEYRAFVFAQTTLCIFCDPRKVSPGKFCQKNIWGFSGNGLWVGGPFPLRTARRNALTSLFWVSEGSYTSGLAFELLWVTIVPASQPASQSHFRNKNGQAVALCVDFKSVEEPTVLCGEAIGSWDHLPRGLILWEVIPAIVLSNSRRQRPEAASHLASTILSPPGLLSSSPCGPYGDLALAGLPVSHPPP